MPSVFTRSILSIGDGGMCVSIPISWARYYGLKPGDKLEVIANGELTVRPLPKEETPTEKQGEANAPPQE